MDTPDPATTQNREALLSVMLSVLIGGFFLVALVIITGGFVFYVFLVGGGMYCFGLLHYYLWGRLFTEQTAGEREEEQLREQAKADDWPLPEPNRRPH